jgi:hypothetical protein
LRLRREIHPINLFFPPFNEFRHLVPFPILGRFWGPAKFERFT